MADFTTTTPFATKYAAWLNKRDWGVYGLGSNSDHFGIDGGERTEAQFVTDCDAYVWAPPLTPRSLGGSDPTQEKSIGLLLVYPKTITVTTLNASCMLVGACEKTSGDDEFMYKGIIAWGLGLGCSMLLTYLMENHRGEFFPGGAAASLVSTTGNAGATPLVAAGADREISFEAKVPYDNGGGAANFTMIGTFPTQMRAIYS